jgi:hypothetical protein
MVVLTLLSGALGLSAVTLTALFRTEVQLRREREQQFAAARLAELWRADAHAASDCIADKDCIFTLPAGMTARYWHEGSRVWREVRRGDQTQHRDSFALPSAAAVSFAKSEEADRTFAHLRAQATGDDRPHAVPVRPLDLRAIVNLHQRASLAEANP